MGKNVSYRTALPRSLLDQVRKCKACSLDSLLSSTSTFTCCEPLQTVGTSERNFAAQRQQVSRF